MSYSSVAHNLLKCPAFQLELLRWFAEACCQLWFLFLLLRLFYVASCLACQCVFQIIFDQQQSFCVCWRPELLPHLRFEAGRRCRH